MFSSCYDPWQLCSNVHFSVNCKFRKGGCFCSLWSHAFPVILLLQEILPLHSSYFYITASTNTNKVFWKQRTGVFPNSVTLHSWTIKSVFYCHLFRKRRVILYIEITDNINVIVSILFINFLFPFLFSYHFTANNPEDKQHRNGAPAEIMVIVIVDIWMMEHMLRINIETSDQCVIYFCCACPSMWTFIHIEA